MANRVKLYEEKRHARAIPLWVWILGLVAVLTCLVLFFTHRNEPPVREPAVTPVSQLRPIRSAATLSVVAGSYASGEFFVPSSART